MIKDAIVSLKSFLINLSRKQSKKVFFFGAGASTDAGYPLTKNLYEELRNYHALSIYKETWIKFSKVIENIKNNYPDFSQCDNIEYLMTILSLSQQYHAGKSIPQSFEQLKENRDQLSKSLSTASNYETARINFAICIEATFAQIDYEMGEDKFEYLKNFLSKRLKNGDIVITTNYDLLIERCLLKLNLWNPHDGYGFNVVFKDDYAECQNENDKEIKHYNSEKSKTKIFKLHGSVGWLNGNNRIVLDTTRMQHHIFQYWKDENYSPNLYNDKHIILPDFLKAFANETMGQIWSQAQHAILNAREVHFIGYSLPEYDANIRTLLLPLREKIINNKCKVKVYLLTKDKDGEERWKDHLTDGIEIIYFDSFKNYKD